MKYLLIIIFFIIIPTFVYAQNKNFRIKSQTDLYLVPIAMGILGTSLIAAHIVSSDTYSWNNNTISELASQNYNHAWIMRSGFIGFGSFISAAATWDLISERKHWAETIPLILYGTSIGLTGFYSAAPFQDGVSFSPIEDQIHSIFANIAGIGLTGAMLGSAITEKDSKMRTMHISSIAFVVIASALFKIDPENQGIWQRILWTGSLTWLTIGFSF